MKIRFFAALLIAALSVTIFTGCAAPVQQMEIVEEKLDDRLDAAEEVIRDALVPAAPAPAAPTVAAATEPVSAPIAATVPGPAPTEATLITKEEAIAIALKDAGFTQDQVTRLRAEFDWDDRRPEYEVEFHQGGYEYDYEIHAETGVILHKDIDRED